MTRTNQHRADRLRRFGVEVVIALVLLVGLVGAIPTATAAEPTGAVSRPSAQPVPAPAASSREREDRRTEQLHTIAWWGFGVAAVGAVAWSVAGGIALAMSASLEEDCPYDACGPTQADDLDTARALAHVATFGFGATVVGSLSGVVALLVAAERGGEPRPPDADDQATVHPYFGPGYLGLHGRF